MHDPGFGSYWTVNLSAPPGTKRPRKRGRPSKVDNPESSTKKRGRPRKNPGAGTATGAGAGAGAGTCDSDVEISINAALNALKSSPTTARVDSEEDFDASFGEENAADGPSVDSDEVLESDDPQKVCSDVGVFVQASPRNSGSLKEVSEQNVKAAYEEAEVRSNHDRGTVPQDQTLSSSTANGKLEKELIDAQKELVKLRGDKERLQQQLDTEIFKRKEAESALATHQQHLDWS